VTLQANLARHGLVGKVAFDRNMSDINEEMFAFSRSDTNADVIKGKWGKENIYIRFRDDYKRSIQVHLHIDRLVFFKSILQASSGFFANTFESLTSDVLK
jgi:hypothetical protein